MEKFPHTYRMDLAFNGSNYSGWQRQTDGTLSVQQVVEDSLRRITGEENLHVCACSRTDRKVHALCMSTSFHTEKVLDPKRASFCMEKQLPHDIRLERLEKAPPGFNAHTCALGKSYVYAVNAGYYNLFLRQGCWSWHDVQSVEILKELLPLLEGTRDFRSFTGVDLSKENPFRTLYRAEMFSFGPVICFYFAGDGFFYKMVRRLVGAMYEVASGKRSADSFKAMLDTPSRPPDDILVAPPEGLYLKKAFYEAGEWQHDSVEQPPFFF